MCPAGSAPRATLSDPRAVGDHMLEIRASGPARPSRSPRRDDPPARRPVVSNGSFHGTSSAAVRSTERESFAALLEESLGQSESFEGTVVKGRVISVENDIVLIDVGLKSEGRVALKEFAVPGQQAELVPGDIVEVFVERMEDKNGEAVLSREKARREEAWTQLEKPFTDSSASPA